MTYHGGDFPASQAAAIDGGRICDFPARQAERAQAEGRYIGIGLANYVEGTGLGPYEGATVRVLPNGKVAGRHRRREPGPGHGHDAGAGGRRAAGLPDRGCRRDARRHRRRFRWASAHSPAARRSPPAAPRTRRALRCANGSWRLPLGALGVETSEIDVEDGRAIARGGNRPSLDFAELARMAQGRPGATSPTLVPGRPGRGPGAHRLFPSAVLFVLQRHPYRGGRGRSDDRRRHALALHGRPRFRRG